MNWGDRGFYSFGRVINWVGLLLGSGQQFGCFNNGRVNPLMLQHMCCYLTEVRLKSKELNGGEIFIVFDDLFEYLY